MEMINYIVVLLVLNDDVSKELRRIKNLKWQKECVGI